MRPCQAHPTQMQIHLMTLLPARPRSQLPIGALRPTGTPIRYTGGPTGQSPDSDISYEVSRVDAADLGH